MHIENLSRISEPRCLIRTETVSKLERSDFEVQLERYWRRRCEGARSCSRSCGGRTDSEGELSSFSAAGMTLFAERFRDQWPDTSMIGFKDVRRPDVLSCLSA
eukprot:2347950-Rhodomonas_salina.1